MENTCLACSHRPQEAESTLRVTRVSANIADMTYNSRVDVLCVKNVVLVYVPSIS